MLMQPIHYEAYKFISFKISEYVTKSYKILMRMRILMQRVGLIMPSDIHQLQKPKSIYNPHNV